MRRLAFVCLFAHNTHSGQYCYKKHVSREVGVGVANLLSTGAAEGYGGFLDVFSAAHWLALLILFCALIVMLYRLIYYCFFSTASKQRRAAASMRKSQRVATDDGDTLSTTADAGDIGLRELAVPPAVPEAEVRGSVGADDYAAYVKRVSQINLPPQEDGHYS